MLHGGHEHRPRTDTILRVLGEILIGLEENVSWGPKIHFYYNSVGQRNMYFILCVIDLNFLVRLIY